MIAEHQVEAAPQMGRIVGESAEIYHATQAISASKLRTFARNPGGAQLYYQKYIAKTLPAEDSEAMMFGRALHCLALEGGEKFNAEFAVLPEDIDRRTTAGKAAYAAFLDESKGKDAISLEMNRAVADMAERIHAHPVAAELLASGESEITWRLQAEGLKHCPPLQVRTDWINEKGCALSQGRPYVLDIKTTATFEESAFGNWQRGFEDHGYHRQAAFYMAVLGQLGVDVCDFFFVAAEKCAPGGVQVFKLGNRALEQGQREIERMLTDINECYRRNWWPNVPLELQEIDLSPRYYARASDQVKEVEFA